MSGVTLAELTFGAALAAGIVIRTKFSEQAQGAMTRLEIEAGEVVELGLGTGVDRTWTLESAPPGSNARVDGGRLVGASVAGIYHVRCTLVGGWSRELDLVALRAEELYGCPPPAGVQVAVSRRPEKRLAVRSWLNAADTTDATIAERFARS